MKKKRSKPLKTTPSRVTHVDLFSGVGGLCTGFESAGISTILAVEKVGSCVDTYRENHPLVNVVQQDIRKVTGSEVKNALSANGCSEVDIVSAGFPCETFSTAGPTSRRYNDYRNHLFEEAIRLCAVLTPAVLLLENVPAFMTKQIEKGSGELVLDLLVSKLESIGYNNISYTTLNSYDFGVPQKRERFFLIATQRSSKILFPGVDFNPVGGPVNVWDALSDLPLIPHSSESEEYASEPRNKFQEIMRSPNFWRQKTASRVLSYHVSPKHRKKTLERFKLINQGEGLRDLFGKLSKEELARLQKEGVLPNSWYIQRNRRLIQTEPSFTITSHCLDELIHPKLDRSLSIREVARLQSFPDYYDFIGGPFLCPHIYETQDKYEQIGDAIPPLLARALGLALLSQVT